MVDMDTTKIGGSEFMERPARSSKDEHKENSPQTSTTSSGGEIEGLGTYMEAMKMSDPGEATSIESATPQYDSNTYTQLQEWRVDCKNESKNMTSLNSNLTIPSALETGKTDVKLIYVINPKTLQVELLKQSRGHLNTSPPLPESGMSVISQPMDGANREISAKTLRLLQLRRMLDKWGVPDMQQERKNQAQIKKLALSCMESCCATSLCIVDTFITTIRTRDQEYFQLLKESFAQEDDWYRNRDTDSLEYNLRKASFLKSYDWRTSITSRRRSMHGNDNGETWRWNINDNDASRWWHKMRSNILEYAEFCACHKWRPFQADVVMSELSSHWVRHPV